VNTVVRPPASHLIVMGVSGCGKSTLASALAQRLELPFAEGDDFHSDQARRQMAAGTPLTDADRRPWLLRIVDWMDAHPDGGVISCSALKRSHRDLLRTTVCAVWFIHLDVPEPVLAARMRARPNHFMPASLLASQLDALERLSPGEGVVMDGTLPVQGILAELESTWQ
jgi:gluconokinase